MPLTVSNPPPPSAIHSLAVEQIRPNPFSLAIYGDPTAEIDDLVESIRKHGVLVPLVVVAEADTDGLRTHLGPPPARLRPCPGIDRSPLRGP